MTCQESRMNPNFEIVSYMGAKPVLFGMTEVQVFNLVGPHLKATINNLGERNAQYESFGIRYSKQEGTVLEIGFGNSAKVTFRGVDLFGDRSAFQFLLALDSSPYEYFGFIVLLDLGITLTGFHDDDPSQRAITVFARGRWDHVKGKFKRFQRT